MNKLIHWLIHDWDLWEDLPAGSGEHIYIKQTRKCKLCGYKQGRSKCYVQRV